MINPSIRRSSCIRHQSIFYQTINYSQQPEGHSFRIVHLRGRKKNCFCQKTRSAAEYSHFDSTFEMIYKPVHVIIICTT
jgi:hypothetical protein